VYSHYTFEMKDFRPTPKNTGLTQSFSSKKIHNRIMLLKWSHDKSNRACPLYYDSCECSIGLLDLKLCISIDIGVKSLNNKFFVILFAMMILYEG